MAEVIEGKAENRKLDFWSRFSAAARTPLVGRVRPAPLAAPLPSPDQQSDKGEAPAPIGVATAEAPESHEAPISALLPELVRLEGLLQRAVARANAIFGAKAPGDLFRGLHISPAEVDELLGRHPGTSMLPVAPEGEAITTIDPENESAMLLSLQKAYGLSRFDLDVIVLALAPEIDLRYERIYAYLQDNVTQRRPCVDLALSLFSQSDVAKLEHRLRFSPECPLLRHALVHLLPDPQQAQSSLLGSHIKLDEQIVRFLLGQRHLDHRLAGFCELYVPLPAASPIPEDVTTLLQQAGLRARAARQPLRLLFEGEKGLGQRQVAEAIATAVGRPVLVADFDKVKWTDTESDSCFALLFREAALHDALLYIGNLDTAMAMAEPRSPEEIRRSSRLLDALSVDRGVTVVAGKDFSALRFGRPLGLVTVRFAMPGFESRRASWANALQAANMPLEPASIDLLADRFRLAHDQIEEAVAEAVSNPFDRGLQEGGTDKIPGSATVANLLAAARAQSSKGLDQLAQKIVPHYTWADLVLPPDECEQLHEICRRIDQQHKVLGEWGFGDKLSRGRGVIALFSGPFGCGKTMAAEVIASELGLALYKIDLSAVVSKYVGDTERNLKRVFSLARTSNAILFFDEADALCGKRSEVREAHDRYANIEIAFLLQEMEEYEGIAILATNLRQNMDEAFTRRLQFIVEFPFPDEHLREAIWKVHFPANAPREANIDFARLAREFRVAGGNIKNIVLGAAYAAASEGRPIGMPHIATAARREYQKLGKVHAVDALAPAGAKPAD